MLFSTDYTGTMLLVITIGHYTKDNSLLESRYTAIIGSYRPFIAGFMSGTIQPRIVRCYLATAFVQVIS
jgi:hypothetical protein